MVIEITKVSSLMAVWHWKILTFIQGHSWTRKQKLLCSFSHNFITDLDEIWYTTMTFGSVQVHATFFHLTVIQVREMYKGDFVRNLLSIGVHLGDYTPISFKRGMMINMTKLCMSMPGSMTMTFTQGHRIMRELELVQSFCCKGAWSSPNSHSGRLCKGDDCKETLCVWWILIGWAFALLVITRLWRLGYKRNPLCVVNTYRLSICSSCYNKTLKAWLYELKPLLHLWHSVIYHFNFVKIIYMKRVFINFFQDVDEFFEKEKDFLLEYHAKIKDATQKSDKMTKVHKSEYQHFCLCVNVSWCCCCC